MRDDEDKTNCDEYLSAVRVIGRWDILMAAIISPGVEPNDRQRLLFNDILHHR